MTAITVNDIVVGIFTGKPFYQTRAVACKKTWVQSFPLCYFYSGEADDNLPVTSIGLVGEDYPSCLPKQFLGLKLMWETHPDKPWFLVCGCDTFILPEGLLSCLRRFNPDNELLIGGKRSYVNSTDLPNIPNIWFPPGGAGLVLSRGLLKKLYPYLDKMLGEWPQRAPGFIGAVDLATAVGAYEIAGISSTEVAGFFSGNPFDFRGSYSFTNKQLRQLVSLHYIKPGLMLFLHNHKRISYGFLCFRALINLLLQNVHSIIAPLTSRKNGVQNHSSAL